MRAVLAFIFALCFMAFFSLPYESWGMPVWPVAVMSLSAGFWLTLIPGLEKYRIHLAIIYFIVFSLLWLQSFPRVITPKATLHYMRGLVWLMTYAIFGMIAMFTLLATIVKAAMDAERKKAIVYALAAIFMGCIVAFVSGPGGGADPIMAWLKELGLSQGGAEAVNLIIRKTIHFTYYGLMAGFAGLAAFHGRLGKASLAPAVTGFLFMLLHAVFDEIRQSGVSVRTGSGFDVLLDSAGAATFLYLLIGKKRMSQRA